jgi:hypothetical protein
VRATIEAFGWHQHLIVRPDEVWFTILTQMNFYMYKYAAEVSHIFNHTNQDMLRIEACCTWRQVRDIFQSEIQERANTPWLVDWIAPSFTTTTEADPITANIIMMGLPKVNPVRSGAACHPSPFSAHKPTGRSYSQNLHIFPVLALNPLNMRDGYNLS